LKDDFLFEDGMVALLVSGLRSDMSGELADIGLKQVINKPLSREMLLGLLSKAKIQKVEESTDDILLPGHGVKNKLLLLAEDSLSNQLVAGAMLKKSGFEVEFANNGIEAVDMAAKKEYGLILMDMRMPEMDGVEATKMILLNEPNTIILAMTANVQQEDVDSCLSVGMKDFVPKPVSRANLTKAINQWLPVLTDKAHVVNLNKNKERVNEFKSCEQANEDISFTDDMTSRCYISPEIEDQSESLEHIDNLFDERVIAELFDVLGQESVEGMYSVYLEETRERLDVLNTLMENLDYTEIDNQAHTLKSSSGSFGAQALYELAKSLEQSAKEQDEKSIELHFSALQQVGEQTLKAFKSRFKV
jgi:CheY-like chemotaxis protein/HPt (histidine-containing phosphotransfer) domain-containing protein